MLLCSLVALATEPAAGPAASAEDRESCEAHLTCARLTNVVSARDFERVVPDLSKWQILPTEPAGRVHQTGLADLPSGVRDSATGMELVLVPGACYLPGPPPGASPTGDGKANGERPVCIEPFYIGAYEVTFDEYDRFAQATSRTLPEDEGWGRGRRPVINVNVYDALSFAKWLSRQAGVRYRLPTEVEWEHAARGGSRSRFPWGDDIGADRANCDGCGSPWDGESTAAVGSFAPNAWGLYDVIGNVGEWTCSMRNPVPSRSFETCDSPYESRRRIYRNGGWSDEPSRLEARFRDWNAAVRRTDFVGFRLVRECPECNGQPPETGAGKLAEQEADGGIAR
jgi:formylglycine-generating enzyme required for sulfatase activity